MSKNIKLIIPQTSSSYLPKALAMARKFSAFEEPLSKEDSYVLSVEPEELLLKHRQLEELYAFSKGWKGTQLYIGDKLADAGSLQSALMVFSCADQKEASIFPEDFCQPAGDPGWGCIRLGKKIDPRLPHSAYQLNDNYAYYWFRVGRFSENQSEWLIDKNRIKTILEKEASDRYIDQCPYFDPVAVQKGVDRLPDSIPLENSSSWIVEYEETYEGSTIQKRPVSIRPKLNTGLSCGDSDLDDAASSSSSKERCIPNISFDDIGGVEDIVDKIREVIELPLRHPKVFEHLAIAPHKGVLLYGPPGCGKTMIAKAIANDINAHFISIRGPELFSKWLGESEENLRAIFDTAREKAPSVIFFDEIDAIAQTRSSSESNRHGAMFVNQLLTLMDGMETYENVCVIASTNRPELLDEAIMRPGRFDYTLEVRHPTPAGCRKIFEIKTRSMPLSSSIDKNQMAAQLDGFSGADIAFTVREAAYNCLRRLANVNDLIEQDVSDDALKELVVEECDFIKAIQTIHSHR
ncbi:MAG: AAA family ATPase [Kiritimatiellaeota bacterium]|nr:AAA family ATPase [Kiritimatiellota bacterium]